MDAGHLMDSVRYLVKGFTSDKQESPLLKANKIVNERSEEQQRRHGPFSEGMTKAATIATVLCGKEITTEDTFKVLMALKLSRMSHSLELDSVVDLMGYTEGLWNYKNQK